MLCSCGVCACVCVSVHSLAALEGSLWPPPLLSDCSPRGAPALLFRAVIGQGPPAELVCSSFVAPRFHSLLKASLWRDAASAASPSSFTLLRPRTHTVLFTAFPDLAITMYNRGEKKIERGRGTEGTQQRDVFNRVWGTSCIRVTAVGPEFCLPNPLALCHFAPIF